VPEVGTMDEGRRGLLQALITKVRFQKLRSNGDGVIIVFSEEKTEKSVCFLFFSDEKKKA
jgi:hypothetical protein